MVDLTTLTPRDIEAALQHSGEMTDACVIRTKFVSMNATGKAVYSTIFVDVNRGDKAIPAFVYITERDGQPWGEM